MNNDTNRKHAYLIMAHNNFEQLQVLISLLDDVRNDIYLHIDKKVTDFKRESVKTEYAGLFFVDPISVTWSGHSQIECEMILFKAAGVKHYMYYHLISGQDMPLKTQDEMHRFFEERSGSNFIEVDNLDTDEKEFAFRTRYYHLFRNITGRSVTPLKLALRIIDKVLVKLQGVLHIKRKEIVPLYKGANWISITDAMLQYILNCEKTIRKQFYYSYCADEIFLQSIVMNSPYRDTIVNDCYRAIDWERGSPYTYHKEDVPALLASTDLFARKFDSRVDNEAILMIAECLSDKTKTAE